MIAGAHAAHLARRHQALDADLMDELKRPSPDVLRTKRLKQLKLRIKDKLAEVDRGQSPHR